MVSITHSGGDSCPVSAVLFLAALVVAGIYRCAFLAGLSLGMAGVIAIIWIGSAYKDMSLTAKHADDDGTTYRVCYVYIWPAHGGIGVIFSACHDTTGSQRGGYPVKLGVWAGDARADYPFSEQFYGEAYRIGGYRIRALRSLGMEAASYSGDESDGGPGSRHWHDLSVTVPCWFLLLLCVPFPACWLYRRLRPRENELPGHCRKCGYDLRAHKVGERCPECGTVVAAGAAGAARKGELRSEC